MIFGLRTSNTASSTRWPRHTATRHKNTLAGLPRPNVEKKKGGEMGEIKAEFHCEKKEKKGFEVFM